MRYKTKEKTEKMKKNFNVVHFIADCLDCDWHYENYKNGQALAALHAKRKGHKVSVEVGLGGYYDGREEAPGERI